MGRDVSERTRLLIDSGGGGERRGEEIDQCNATQRNANVHCESHGGEQADNAPSERLGPFLRVLNIPVRIETDDGEIFSSIFGGGGGLFELGSGESTILQ